MDLDGQWAVVTGAGRGIGKGCALELARRGANLVVNDRPGGSDLLKSVSEIEAMGRTCVAVEADAPVPGLGKLIELWPSGGVAISSRQEGHRAISGLLHRG